MPGYTRGMEKLIEVLGRMPGVGRKTAERLAFYIIKSPAEEIKALSETMLKVKDAIRFCSVCNNFSERQLCDICEDARRDKSVLCIVSQPSDIAIIEKTRAFNGLYHVLLGELSPLDGIGPDELKIKELVSRIKKGKVKEVIVATNLSTEGETTALYLGRLLKPLGVKVTRLARGVPVGASLELQDQATLAQALEGRREL